MVALFSNRDAVPLTVPELYTVEFEMFFTR